MSTLHPFNFMIEGRRYFARTIQPSDKEFLRQGFEELSPESRHLRFSAYQQRLTDKQLKYFTEIDGIDHVAWGILDVTDEREVIPVAVGRFVRLEERSDIAEVAFAVVDDYQHKGIGGILLSILNIAGQYADIKVFRYYVLTENHFVIRNLRLLGILKMEEDCDTLLVDVPILSNPDDVPEHKELESFRSSLGIVKELITSN